MLWSLIKIVLFVTLAVALAYGGGLLLETDGQVRITAFGTEFTVGPFVGVLVVAGLIGGLWAVLKLIGLTVAVLRFVNGDETAVSRYFNRRDERRGFEALAEGMMALASGEGRVAMSKAARAEKYLRRPELTNLLAAQAAEMAGDRHTATETYKKLLTDDRTRFVGVRGIMKQKLAEGDTETALQLAEKAFALKPKHTETGDILLRLQAGQGDWTGARQTLGTKLKTGALPRDVHRRRDAVLALSQAAEILDEGTPIEMKERAIEANRLSPDLVPAAVMASRSYIAENNAKHATRVLKKAWEGTPHPDLARAFAAIAPDETPSERLKRFQTLTKLHPADPETKMLLAELHIAAEDFPAARRALGDLAEKGGTARALTIQAAIERGEGADDAVVRGWLTAALSAPRGARWVCDNCQTVHSDWAPVCSNCDAFDTMSWQEAAPGSEPREATGTDLLPLIVGGAQETLTEAALPDETEQDTGDTVEDAEIVASAVADASAQNETVPVNGAAKKI